MKLSEMREALKLNASRKELTNFASTSEVYVMGILCGHGGQLPESVAERIAPEVCDLVRRAVRDDLVSIDGKLRALGAEPDEPIPAGPVELEKEPAQ